MNFLIWKTKNSEEVSNTDSCPSVVSQILVSQLQYFWVPKQFSPKEWIQMINDTMKFLDCIHIFRRDLLLHIVEWSKVIPHHFKMDRFNTTLILEL